MGQTTEGAITYRSIRDRRLADQVSAMEQGYNSVLELAIDELTIVVFELRDRITILENPNPELVDGDPED